MANTTNGDKGRKSKKHGRIMIQERLDIDDGGVAWIDLEQPDHAEHREARKWFKVYLAGDEFIGVTALAAELTRRQDQRYRCVRVTMEDMPYNIERVPRVVLL